MIEQYETWEGFKETLIERVGTCFSIPVWNLIEDYLDVKCIRKPFTEADVEFGLIRIHKVMRALESKKGKRE